MSNKFEKRKIGFYSIKLKNGNDYLHPNTLFSYLDNIVESSKQIRIIKVISQNKIKFLDSLNTINESTRNLIFKQAIHDYTPPLISAETGNERRSPKKKEEGEVEKTHSILTIKDNEEIIMILEEKKGKTLTPAHIKHYFEQQIKQVLGKRKLPFEIEVSIIAGKFFLDELNALERVTNGELYVEKSILGSEFLNYSDRTETVKKDIKIVISAEVSKSIVETIKDIFGKRNISSTIKKIRVKGIDEKHFNRIIDTDMIKMTDEVQVILDSNGVIDSGDFFGKVNNIVEEVKNGI